MGKIANRVLDNGLADLKALATHIYICNAEPTTYVEATSTFALGNKLFGAGAVFPAAIADGVPNGRMVTTAPVTDGVITADGTATHWAVVDSVNFRLLVGNDLLMPLVVTGGNVLTLPAFNVRQAGVSAP